MNKFNDIIDSYVNGVLNEQDPGVDPAAAPAQPPAQPPVDAVTTPAPEAAPMTTEGRIQMLDMVRKALLISPTELKEHEKVTLSTLTTHENVEEKKRIIESIFTRLQTTGTDDLESDSDVTDEEY